MKKKTKVVLVVLMALTIPLTIFSQDIGQVFTFGFALGSANFYEPFEDPEPNAPDSLPVLENITWEQVLAEAITNFKKIPNQYLIEVNSNSDNNNGTAYYKPEVNDALINLLSPETKQKIHPQLEIIMKDYQLQTDFYNWVRPHFLQTYRKLEPQYRGFYLQVIDSLNQYVKEMNYDWESYYLAVTHENKWPNDDLLEKYYREDYNTCYNPVNPNPHSKYQFSPSCNPAPGTEAFSFYLYDAHGKKTLHRKLHTWLFFQIHNGPMMRWEWRYWLQIAYRDLLAESHKIGQWDIVAVPKELPKLQPDVWQSLLIMGLDSFFHNPHIYDCEKDPDFGKDATMVYGVLAPANFWGRIPDDVREGEAASQQMMDAIFTIMKSPNLRKITYNWLKKPYTQAFVSLPQKYQDIYIEILEHGNQYLATYDYQAELAYYEQLKNEANLPPECESKDSYFAKHKKADRWDYGNDCYVHGFVYTNHKGEDRQFAKLEAWYFRQIYNDRMTLSDLKYWNKKLLHDAKQAQATTVAVHY